MKNFKRIISAFCIVLMLVSVLSVFPASADAVTIDSLKKQFPAGKYWNGGNPNSYTDKPCTHHGNCSKNDTDYSGWCGCNSYQGEAIQCMGFAYQLAYLVYGGNPYRWLVKEYNKETAMKNLKAGDVVRYRNNGHSIFITKVEGNNVTFADCNWNHNCNIRWDVTTTKDALKSTLTYVHVAPYEWGDLQDDENLCDCDVSYAGEYICNTESSPLRIRSGHDTSSAVVGQIASKDTVSVTMSDGEWAHVVYKGISGFASMEYLKLSKPAPYVKLDKKSLDLSVSSVNTGVLTFSHANLPDDAEIDFGYDKNVISLEIKGEKITVKALKAGRTNLTVSAKNKSGTLCEFSCIVTVNDCVHTYTDVCDKLCDKCKGERIPPHNYGEYVSDKNATMEKDGTKTRVCKNCNAKDTTVDEGSKIVDVSVKFKDISKDAWYYEFVGYAVNNDIFSGMSDTEFAPEITMTRAQFVQVLANLSGVDTSNKAVTTEFSDVPSGKWYTCAIKWAADNKIVSGMGDGFFRPDDKVTREQMCLMLVNYAEYEKITLKETEQKAVFADDALIADWAEKAVYKCQSADLIGGVGDNMFSPKTFATRAQGATVFSQFHKDYIA